MAFVFVAFTDLRSMLLTGPLYIMMNVILFKMR